LAEELTRTVHGAQGLRIAQRASEVLFGGSMDNLQAEELLGIFASVPSAELPAARVTGAALVDLCAAAGLCKSKGEARRLIVDGGLYVNNVRLTAIDTTVRPEMLIEGRLLVLRSGKRTFHLVKVV